MPEAEVLQSQATEEIPRDPPDFEAIARIERGQGEQLAYDCRGHGREL